MTRDEMLEEAVALLREWGTGYDDPRFPKSPPYGDRIREFLERVVASDIDPTAGGDSANPFGRIILHGPNGECVRLYLADRVDAHLQALGEIS